MSEGGPSPGTAAPVAALSLTVDVLRHDPGWAEAGISDAMLERAAYAALEGVPDQPPGAYEMAIVLTGDAEMADLNRIWRGKDAPTNVLSFPAGAGIRAPGFLGDVVLAYDTTLHEARDGDLSLADHVSHLVVHGTLHLLGFDHLAELEAENMEALERQVLAGLGIADPYLEPGVKAQAELSS